MSDAQFAILDPVAGISGDMLLGALIGAGAPREWLLGLPARLRVDYERGETEHTDRCGIQATKVSVILPGGIQEKPSDSIDHPDHESHSHDHPSAYSHPHS